MATPGVVAKKDLWSEAHSRFSEEEQRRLKAVDPSKLEIVEEVYKLVETRQAEVLNKRWRLYTNKSGEKIYIRDILGKIKTWITKFREIGDIVVQYDPTHASLPWAGVRLLLQIAVSDAEKFGAMLSGLERISSLITRYAIFEQLYLQGDFTARPKLEEAMLRLYESILFYLLRAEEYYGRHTFTRAMRSIGDVDVHQHLNDVEEHEKRLKEWSELIEREQTIQINAATYSLQKLLQSFERPIIRIRDQLEALHDNLTKEKRQNLLHWLSQTPYRRHQTDALKGVVPGSGAWLLRRTEFHRWLHSSCSSTLWLHGIPGAGKTRLASIVINELQEEAKETNSPAPIAYFFCARVTAEPLRANPDEIMSALLKQIGTGDLDTSVGQPIHEKYNEHLEEVNTDGAEIRRLEIDESVSLILKLLEHTPAIIIIDALDECDPDRRGELFDAITRLMDESESVVKIFVSSRDDVDIVDYFDNFSNIRISAIDNREDIEQFVKQEVAVASKRKLLRGRASEILKQKIIYTLINGAQGMFRWVELQMQSLCDVQRMKTEDDVLKALGSLPKTLSESYKEVYSWVLDSGETSRELAENAISFLLCTMRPLSGTELAALSSSHFSDPHSATPQQVADVCCNLLSLDAEHDIIKFAHLSVREFFEDHPDYTKDKVNTTAARITLGTTLKILETPIIVPSSAQVAGNYGEKGQLILNTRDLLEQANPDVTRSALDALLLHGEALIKHALIYWPCYYERISLEHRCTYLQQYLQQLFSKHASHSDSLFQRWLAFAEVYRCTLRWPDPLEWKLFYIQCQSVIPFAASYGLIELFTDFPEYANLDWSFKLLFGLTGMHLAASNNYDSLVRFFLSHGQDVHVQDHEGRTPLHWACWHGFDTCVQTLLDAGADVNHENFEGNSAAAFAAWYGHTSTLKILHGAGASMDKPNRNTSTPLCLAAWYAYFDAVEYLAALGCDVNVATTDGYTPLSQAADGGHTKTCEILLKLGAEIETSDKYGQRALARAVAAGREGPVRLLLKHGASYDFRDQCGHTPLSRAAWHGQAVTARMLLEIGHAAGDMREKVNVNSQDGEGKTPLNWAATNGHSQVAAELLLVPGLELELADNLGKTPLQHAEEKGHEAIVEAIRAEMAARKMKEIVLQEQIEVLVEAVEKGIEVMEMEATQDEQKPEGKEERSADWDDELVEAEAIP